MKITYKGDYAIKTVLELALRHGEGVQTIHELAKKIDAPIKFLEQVLLDLKRGGFVQSRRGKAGGYVLTRKPGEIRLGEVIRYMDGPTGPIACVEEHYKGCKEVNRCILKTVWKDVDRAVSGIVDSVTFEDLAKRNKSEEEVLNFTI
jgi:Rrf2 family protein